MNRSACRAGVRDLTATAIEAVFALWLLILVVAAPWEQGAGPALVTIAVTCGISLLLYRRAVEPLIARFLFGHGRRHRCLDPLARLASRFPNRVARQDPAWAAITKAPHMPLHDYYLSEPWRQRRRLKLAEAGHRCEQCGAADRLQVHHLTYRRKGRERRRDLLVLCCACHGRVHRKNLCSFGRSGEW
jgi:hypothetical protein